QLDARRRHATQPRRFLSGLFHVLMRTRTIFPGRFAVFAALLICAFVLLVPAPAHTQTGDIAVVVHPDVPVSNLSLADLRRILLGDREFWTTGVRVTLLIRAPIARERDAAVKDVCQMTEAQ